MSSASKITVGVVIVVLMVGVAVIDSIANKPRLVYERGVPTEGRPGGVLVRAYVERSGLLPERLLYGDWEGKLILEVGVGAREATTYSLRVIDDSAPRISEVIGGRNQVQFMLGHHGEVTYSWSEDGSSGTWHW